MPSQIPCLAETSSLALFTALRASKSSLSAQTCWSWTALMLQTKGTWLATVTLLRDERSPFPQVTVTKPSAVFPDWSADSTPKVQMPGTAKAPETMPDLASPINPQGRLRKAKTGLPTWFSVLKLQLNLSPTLTMVLAARLATILKGLSTFLLQQLSVELAQRSFAAELWSITLMMYCLSMEFPFESPTLRLKGQAPALSDCPISRPCFWSMEAQLGRSVDLYVQPGVSVKLKGRVVQQEGSESGRFQVVFPAKTAETKSAIRSAFMQCQ